METVMLGATGIQVSRLGIGLSEIGSTPLEVSTVETLLNTGLDAGVNFLDTAACYGNSEELVGMTVSHRRNEYTLATKCGHVAGGYNGTEWTAQLITHSIDRSLARMKTDYVDIMQLHSCRRDVLERGDVIEALVRAKDAGKVRFIGYSGDNEAAEWAVDSGIFDSLQTSFSLVDQRARSGLLSAAEAKNMGIIIKRPIANFVWGKSSVTSSYHQKYLERAQVMSALGPIAGEADSIKFAMGFTFAHKEVDTAIIGTTNPAHLLANIALLDEGVSMESGAMDTLTQRFTILGEDWPQLS